MSVTEQMGELLCAAAGIIRRQAALLEMHGITTADGGLEQRQRETVAAIRSIVGPGDNRCVCCGEVIPEGRQVCPDCEKAVGTCAR